MMRLLLFLVFLGSVFLFSEQNCRAQKLELTNADDFRNRVEGDDSDFKVIVQHTSDAAGFEENSFSIDWGDGESEEYSQQEMVTTNGKNNRSGKR